LFYGDSLKPTVSSLSPSSSSSSSSLKSTVSSSKATQRYSLLNIIVILILIVITSSTTLVMIKGYQYIITLENKISTFADQMEDANFLNKALQEEVSDMAKEKSLYIKQIDQYRSELNRIEKKFSACVNELKGDLSKADKNKFDNDMKDLNKGEDDKQDTIYAWFASFFNYQDSENHSNKKQKQIKCPFTSAAHALEQFILNRKWIELQRSSIASDLRKQILKELSLQFHPDKIKQFGCPEQYGEKIMVLINEKREIRGRRKNRR
jgi:hypothetical protein